MDKTGSAQEDFCISDVEMYGVIVRHTAEERFLA
jgi:hypothetical protein